MCANGCPPHTHIIILFTFILYYNVYMQYLYSGIILLCRHVIRNRNKRGIHIIIFLFYFLFYIRICVNLCFWRSYIIYDEGIQNATGSDTKKENNETRTIEVYTNHHSSPPLPQRVPIFIYYTVESFLELPFALHERADNDIARCCSYSIMPLCAHGGNFIAKCFAIAFFSSIKDISMIRYKLYMSNM